MFEVQAVRRRPQNLDLGCKELEKTPGPALVQTGHQSTQMLPPPNPSVLQISHSIPSDLLQDSGWSQVSEVKCTTERLIPPATVGAVETQHTNLCALLHALRTP